MRIRVKIVLYFIALCIGLLYLGLAHLSFSHDKILHGTGFFLFSGLLYWTIDLSQRRAIIFTTLVSFIGCILSEFLQAALSSRIFDWWDIVANLVGSTAAIAFNTVLHRRVIDIRRKSNYDRMRSHTYAEESQMELDDIV